MILKLDSNENLFGASPYALAAAQVALSHAQFYPDSKAEDLRQVLAPFHRLPPEQITFGNGSDQILELIVKSYLHHDEIALVSQYAFLTIPLIINSYRKKMLTIPALNYAHDFSAMLAAINKQTRLIFIVNPNNPTGTCADPDELRQFLAAVPPAILVVIDEAYYEYLPSYPNTVEWLRDFSNLILTRTFSKAYGLAGLRLGYALSSPAIADTLNHARLPYHVNRIALAAVPAALADQAHMAHVLQQTEQGKQQLQQGLRGLGLSFLPVQGNFLTINVGEKSSAIHHALQQQGILTRKLQDYGLPEFLRVTVSNKQDNALFLEKLNSLV